LVAATVSLLGLRAGTENPLVRTIQGEDDGLSVPIS
jgi:hypothetical protein